MDRFVCFGLYGCVGVTDSSLSVFKTNTDVGILISISAILNVSFKVGLDHMTDM